MMRNTFYPSLTSEHFSIGNNEFRMSNLVVSSLMDTKMNVQNNGFYFQSPKPFNADNNWLIGGDLLDFSDQHILDLQPGYEYMIPSSNISHLPTKKLPIMPAAADTTCKTRKYPLEAEDQLVSGEVFSEKLCDKNTVSISGDWKKGKRKRAASDSSQFHRQSKDGPVGIPQCRRVQLPVRRSQKIGDKITALQKLVSPYGKTDTASVLQEASFYIKLLQEQIQVLSSSYTSIRGIQRQPCLDTSDNGENRGLRSRGLCLVPISSVQEVTAEDHIHARMIF